MNQMLTFSASKLAAMIRSGEATSAEVVGEHIDHIKKVNPHLNAVVKDRFEIAMKESEKADAELKKMGAEKVPPFHGVPCTIKECFSLTGMPQASGLVARAGYIAESDATAVSRVRRSGAIPMGVTNTSELCMWMESNNRVYGRSNNPYNPDHIVGGSSGGEGAIIGAGGSPFGIGSDVGGSIRMPAFFNGVFGHKCSSGLIPNSGQHPVGSGQVLNYLSTGPLCRKAEDIWPLVKLLAGPDGNDTSIEERELGDPEKVDLSEYEIVVVDGNGKFRISDDMRESLFSAADAFSKKGARIGTASFELLKDSVDIWSSMLADAGGPSFSELLGQGKPIHAWKELGKWFIGDSVHTLPALILSIVEQIPKRFPKRTKEFVEKGHVLREQIAERLGPKGILLYPSYSRPAPKHYVPMLLSFHWIYTGILNVMEMPATQVPMGLNAKGLPLGVQVASVHGNDHVTVAAALELERQFGGWVPPSLNYL